MRALTGRPSRRMDLADQRRGLARGLRWDARVGDERPLVSGRSRARLITPSGGVFYVGQGGNSVLINYHNSHPTQLL